MTRSQIFFSPQIRPFIGERQFWDILGYYLGDFGRILGQSNVSEASCELYSCVLKALCGGGAAPLEWYCSRPACIGVVMVAFVVGHSPTSHLNLSRFNQCAVLCPVCDELRPIELVTRCLNHTTYPSKSV